MSIIKFRNNRKNVLTFEMFEVIITIVRTNRNMKGAMNMCVGQRIKRYLNDNGISQTFVSKKTGIPLPKLNLSLNGNRKISLEEYSDICKAISVGTDKFLDVTNNNDKE